MTEATTDILEPTTDVTTQATAGDQGGADQGATGGKDDAGKDGGKTALEGGDKPADKGSVPDNWRDLLTGGNEEIAKLINRYGNPANVGKALLEKERLIREGKPKAEKPADASDEKAMAEWRKAVGIPDDPTGYKLPETVTKALTDADKPVLAQFTEFAHKKGATPDAVAIATEWYVESQRAVLEQQSEADLSQKDETEDALRSEWSPAEYKGNLGLAKRVLDDSPLGAMGWAGLRGEDGRLLGNNPDFMKWASDLGRQIYGDGVFANSDVAARHESRRAEIEKIRNTDFARYEQEGLDKELRKMIEIDLKRKK